MPKIFDFHCPASEGELRNCQMPVLSSDGESPGKCNEEFLRFRALCFCPVKFTRALFRAGPKMVFQMTLSSWGVSFSIQNEDFFLKTLFLIN